LVTKMKESNSFFKVRGRLHLLNPSQVINGQYV
jgi:hypothetical protein